jgi:branched-chain amino acid transport system substrate-binding protein
MRGSEGWCWQALLTSLAAADAASAQGPIKIGFLSPLSGAIAAAGKDMYSGCELFWQESGWQMAGRKVEVVLEDNEGNPATTLTKARKLVESDKVHLLMGVILSNVAYALVPYVEQQGIPTMYPINSADDLTQRKRPKWLIRTGFSAGGNMHPFGEYVAKTLGYKKVAVVGLDYAFGWETVGGFHKSFEDNGGQIIQKLWVPLNVQDYGPYLSQIKKDADAVFVNGLGGGRCCSPSSTRRAGSRARCRSSPTAPTATSTCCPSSATSRSASSAPITTRRPGDAGQPEVPCRPTRRPTSGSPASTARTATRARASSTRRSRTVGGKVEDRAGLMAALRAVKVADAPRGPVEMDAYGNPTQNIYIRKVERVGGKLQNTVIFTYPRVSQFWTYNPEAFLKQPVYSRDFPPCKHC